ncbi:MAG: hypothetical protein SP1CHLAM54_00260 [Chlamydiia bacterium]|nr:hypothetical protein [Chlamydiia bacterium]MCH9614948.1 hypothetical protein [Chlamydiia bacterium]MCH9630002.1 hypothetical protein [Chlamydiia bacterium]
MATVASRDYSFEPACTIIPASKDFLELRALMLQFQTCAMSRPPDSFDSPVLSDIATRFHEEARPLPGLLTIAQGRFRAALGLLTCPGTPAPRVSMSGHSMGGAHILQETDNRFPWLSTSQIRVLEVISYYASRALRAMNRLTRSLLEIHQEASLALARHVFTNEPLHLTLHAFDREGMAEAVFAESKARSFSHRQFSQYIALRRPIVRVSTALPGPIEAHYFIAAIRIILIRSAASLPETRRVTRLANELLELNRATIANTSRSITVQTLETYQQSVLTALPPTFPDFLFSNLIQEYAHLLSLGESSLPLLSQLHSEGMFLLAKRAHAGKSLPERFTHYDLRIFFKGYFAYTANPPRGHRLTLEELMHQLFTEYERTTVPAHAIKAKLAILV